MKTSSGVVMSKIDSGDVLSKLIQVMFYQN